MFPVFRTSNFIALRKDMPGDTVSPMKKKGLYPPGFFIDNTPPVDNPVCRELLRVIEIRATAPDIYVWLHQLCIAPYSFDILDNKGVRSPRYIISNLPPLRLKAHFLLAFHVYAFSENQFIACRFCEPLNSPLDKYLRSMFIEYRIVKHGDRSVLWCKVKGYYNSSLPARVFFMLFASANKIMMTRQLKNIRRLSQLTAAGKIETRKHDLSKYYFSSGVHWWIFCRRRNCKGLITSEGAQ